MTQQARIYESIQKKNVPINKGHFFELESKERIDNFTRKLSYGWEDEYKEYRRQNFNQILRLAFGAVAHPKESLSI